MRAAKKKETSGNHRTKTKDNITLNQLSIQPYIASLGFASHIFLVLSRSLYQADTKTFHEGVRLQKLPTAQDLPPSKESWIKLHLGLCQSRKIVEIVLNSDQIPRQQNRKIDNFIC